MGVRGKWGGVAWGVGIAVVGGACAVGDGSPQATGLGSGLGSPTANPQTGTGDNFDDGDDGGQTTSGGGGATGSDDPTGTPDPTTADGPDGGPDDGPDDATDDGPPVDCVGDGECDDGDVCTTDTCELNVCQSVPIACDDGVSCTTDSCDPVAGCVATPDDTACANADACDGAETCDATLGCQPGLAVQCNDGDACTNDVCNPATGVCGSSDIVACVAGDGCCPVGCSAAVDNDCVCTNNAGSATASLSVGGNDATGYGPANWIDGVNQAGCSAASCFECYGWINNDTTASGQWMQLTWPATQTIGSMVLDTSPSGSGICAASQNRNVEDGTVQYWNGAAWVNATTFSNQMGDVSLSFDPPLQTTQVRVFDVTASPPTGDNSLLFEWYVYEPLDCSP